ncbi:MAG: hypothetical protein B6247_29010 [Candidatus Parabeggiatoa sp. nov. 2]|nr:MAG: hypothetical protein B6247_29010 [Beggiatoa sp. 4572_84]
MRNIKKYFDNPPAILLSDGCHKKIQEALIQKNHHHFSSYYYGNKDKVRQVLEALYDYKCAYCETNTTAGATLQVDHYRPKNKIQEESNHTGYYWLGYEWSNLMLICSQCNGKSAKSNKFPIAPTGIRVTTPPLDNQGELNKALCRADSQLLLDEKALLLNPEIDKPEEHLVFLPNGQIKGITERGKKTIDICNLNRKSLVFKRKKVLHQLQEELEEYLDDFLTHQISEEIFHYSLKKFFQRLEKSTRSYDNSYLRLRWFMFYKFERFFISALGIKQQEIVKMAFALFKQGKL